MDRTLAGVMFAAGLSLMLYGVGLLGVAMWRWFQWRRRWRQRRFCN